MVNDFRIVKRRLGNIDFFQVHRVFYQHGKEVFIETSPATLIGNTAKVILEDVDSILSALEKPTLIIPEWNRDVKGS